MTPADPRGSYSEVSNPSPSQITQIGLLCDQTFSLPHHSHNPVTNYILYDASNFLVVIIRPVSKFYHIRMISTDKNFRLMGASKQRRLLFHNLLYHQPLSTPTQLF